MQDKIIFIGIGLIFLGIALLVIGSFFGAGKQESKINTAVGGFVGPIPFGFFTSKKMFWVWILILITFTIFYLVFRKFIN